MSEPSETVMSEKEPAWAWRELHGIWKVLGIIIAALSLISLIQNWGNITLSESAGQVLDFYRNKFADPLKTLLFDSWVTHIWPGWKFPTYAFDLVAIWFLCAGTGLRAGINSLSYRKRYTQTFRVSSDGIEITATDQPLESSIPWLSYLFWYFGAGPFALIKEVWEALCMVSDKNARLKLILDFGVESGTKFYKTARNLRYRTLFISAAPFLVTAIFFIWNGLSGLPKH